MTTIMQPFHCDLQPQVQETRIELRTQEQPLVAEHRGGTHYARNDRSRTRRTQEVPFIAGCSHFTRKKMHGFVLRLPPQHKPHATFMQPLQYVSQHHVANLHLSTRMATPDDNNHTAITGLYCCVMPSLAPQSHTTLHWVYCYVTVSHHPSLRVLLQVRVIRNSEDCFPTSRGRDRFQVTMPCQSRCRTLDTIFLSIHDVS